jgi:hypothetical protein
VRCDECGLFFRHGRSLREVEFQLAIDQRDRPNRADVVRTRKQPHLIDVVPLLDLRDTLRHDAPCRWVWTHHTTPVRARVRTMHFDSDVEQPYVRGMNDNTSNTPDNASRPGNNRRPIDATRPRNAQGRFLSKAEIAERNRQEKELEQLNSAVNDLTIEGFENLPLAGSNGELTVGEFLDQVHKFQEKDPIIGAVIRSTERKATRIGQHVDVENKTTAGHTRRSKVKNDKKREPVVDSRRTLLYQVRTLPDNRGYGLYYADGVAFDDPMRKPSDIARHWLGENWYQSFSDGAAKVFASANDARKFRRDHFSTVGVDDESVKQRREARNQLTKTFRTIAGNRVARKNRRPEKKNTPVRKERTVRKDLVELYKLLGK